MIAISREDAVVIVTLTGSYPINGRTWPFRWNAGTEWAAILLEHHFETLLSTELTRIRKEAYEAGWKDAKAHRVKQAWFSARWK